MLNETTLFRIYILCTVILFSLAGLFFLWSRTKYPAKYNRTRKAVGQIFDTTNLICRSQLLKKMAASGLRVDERILDQVLNDFEVRGWISQWDETTNGDVSSKTRWYRLRVRERGER